MLITVASLKGGVGKTTAAIHIAAYLSTKAPTLLCDYDPNKSASAWSESGKLPFKVIDERQLARHARDYEHIVSDTEASLKQGELKSLVDGCDLLVIPVTPDALSIKALLLTVEGLQGISAAHYKILLSVIPPLPSRAGEEARATLTKLKLPLFKAGVRRFVAHQKAALAGVTVNQADDPHAGDAWSDYQAVGREILK